MIDFREELNKQENPKAKIWRYMDFTKFVSLLEKKKLFFAQQSELEDKYEGRVPEKRLNELISRARDLANREHLDQFAKDHFKATAECIERTYSLMDDIRYSMYVFHGVNKMDIQNTGRMGRNLLINIERRDNKAWT